MNKKTADSRLNYLLHIPEGYGTEIGKKWPLIVFLHGLKQRGNKISVIAHVGLPKMITALRDFPFFVISPQCPLRTFWDRPKTAVKVKETIDRVVGDYDIDTGRLYLTGYSMGGYGTWYIAALYPDLFAAIIPICGGGNVETAKKIAHIPTWVFHGKKDSVVSIKKSYKMVDALEIAGSKSLKYTFYPRHGHNCCDATYSNTQVYKWMLMNSKERSQIPPP
jgi:predicted peptidase